MTSCDILTFSQMRQNWHYVTYLTTLSGCIKAVISTMKPLPSLRQAMSTSPTCWENQTMGSQVTFFSFMCCLNFWKIWLFAVMHTYFIQDDTIWYKIMIHYDSYVKNIQTRVYLLVMVSPKAGLLGEGDTLKVHLCSILPLLALISHYPDGTKMSWISKKSNIPKSHIQLDVTCLQPHRSVYLGISFKDFWLVLVHWG